MNQVEILCQESQDFKCKVKDTNEHLFSSSPLSSLTITNATSRDFCRVSLQMSSEEHFFTVKNYDLKIDEKILDIHENKSIILGQLNQGESQSYYLELLSVDSDLQELRFNVKVEIKCKDLGDDASLNSSLPLVRNSEPDVLGVIEIPHDDHVEQSMPSGQKSPMFVLTIIVVMSVIIFFLIFFLIKRMVFNKK